MHVVPGGDGHAVERGRLIVPAAKRGLDLFVDAVADRLHDFRLDHVSLGVDGDFDHDISLQVAGKFGAVHGRIWIYDRIRDVDFMSGDWPVNHRAQRRSGARVVVAGFRIDRYLPRLGRSLQRLGLRVRARLARPWREQQLGRVWGTVLVCARSKVNQFVAVGAFAIG